MGLWRRSEPALENAPQGDEEAAAEQGEEGEADGEHEHPPQHLDQDVVEERGFVGLLVSGGPHTQEVAGRCDRGRYAPSTKNIRIRPLPFTSTVSRSVQPTRSRTRDQVASERLIRSGSEFVSMRDAVLIVSPKTS